ncbi:MAG: alpha/beta hydrolase fold domain-containing protein, partial [Proteobacteria bacterium]|nr:alpha/beta hydrolase fold domain-containing protein [Pseudomonadota bacterium]
MNYSNYFNRQISFFLFVFFLPLLSNADGGFLRTAAPLDEHRGYCLDVAGFGSDARPDEPLRAHTCKYGEDNVDQMFKWVDEQSGHVAIPAYDRCLAVNSMEPGVQLFVNQCELSDLQAWTFVPNGNLSLRAQPDLCVTVGEVRNDAGSDPMMFPGYGWRVSTLESCRERGDELQDIRWGSEDEQRRGNANALRSGMSKKTAEGIRKISESNASDVITRTRALYESEPRTYRPTEVEKTANIAYGEHERQILDVHVDTQRRGEDLQPVVVYFHGGGYVRGSKEGSRNVTEYFASLGLVGVNATYRLAPEIQWPQGAQDVGRAVSWVHKNIQQYGGDPDRIFVIGKSAAGGHVATYALRPDVFGERFPDVAAGVVLISGDFVADTANPTDNHIAYYGEDIDSWKDKQVLGNILQAGTAVMLTSSEFELPGIDVATLGLAN